MKKFVTLLKVGVLALVATTAVMASAHAENLETVSGQVVKIDAERGKVTLKHERIKSIKMAAMTMPFKVKDVSMLSALKPDDKVRFSVAKLDDELVITQLTTAPSPSPTLPHTAKVQP